MSAGATEEFMVLCLFRPPYLIVMSAFYAACDKACKDSCTGAGPDMCDECADGYELNEEEDACKGEECVYVGVGGGGE